ncbi:MAG: HD domain-containing phosphohydrolase [Actinomycetota bacterium]
MSELKINLLDLSMCISDAVDLVNKTVANHHRQVAYIAYCIGGELGLSEEQQSELLLAGALHDIGALSLKERLYMLNFEVDHPHEHAAIGYRLLKIFQPFSQIAEIIRMHHVAWNNGAGLEFSGKSVPVASHILHLADRVAVSIKKDQEILSQADRICKKIIERSGKMFMPEAVDAFLRLACKESFWFDLVLKSTGAVLPQILPRNMSQSKAAITPAITPTITITITLDGALDLARLFSQIIDFRSRLTATHSSGVAASAEALAKFAGYTSDECKMMKIAGYLHDLGKLAVPAEILEKPASLTKAEFQIIRRHPYLTYRILEAVDELQTINIWGALHHERMDGNGYPFHLKGSDLPEGSRIMAVADVFTAITEDRPYRKGMDEEQALKILKRMVLDSALDGDVVSVLASFFEEINRKRIDAQKLALKVYQEFEDEVRKCA